LWGNTAATDIQGTITFTNNADFSSRNQVQPFWGCVPPLQTAKPAGNYTDSVTMTLRQGATILDASAFPVTIIVPASCSFPTAPGTVAFTYTAFQAGIANASTGFQVRCNNQLPYGLSVGAATSVVGGLQYSLAISPLGPYVGTGFAQAFTINGTMPGGQAGACVAGNCLATEARTLTVTY
jgi:spore coat protein U-like protein